MANGVHTLEEERDEAAVRRARDYRRVGLVALLLLVVAGLAGAMGVTSTTVTAEGGGSTLAVTHARVTRAGVAVPLHVSVRRPGGFDGPIRLAVSAALLERFDFQNFYPNPAKETASSGAAVVANMAARRAAASAASCNTDPVDSSLE